MVVPDTPLHVAELDAIVQTSERHERWSSSRSVERLALAPLLEGLPSTRVPNCGAGRRGSTAADCGRQHGTFTLDSAPKTRRSLARTRPSRQQPRQPIAMEFNREKDMRQTDLSECLQSPDADADAKGEGEGRCERRACWLTC